MMNTSIASSLYHVPTEIIDRVIFWIVNRTNFHFIKGIQRDLLSLSRIEKVGGRWMESAEKQLWRLVEIEDFTRLEILIELDPKNERFNYIRKVIFNLDESYSEKKVVEGMQFFHSFCARLTKLTKLSIVFKEFIWLHLRNILCHIHTLSTLFLRLKCEEEDGPVSISHISPLLSLTDLHLECDSCDSDVVDLAQFFGARIFENLKLLKLTGTIFAANSPIFHLFPCLHELHVEFWDDLDLFTSLPPSLRKLKTACALAEVLKNLNDAPFHLTHLNLTEYKPGTTQFYLSSLLKFKN